MSENSGAPHDPGSTPWASPGSQGFFPPPDAETTPESSPAEPRPEPEHPDTFLPQPGTQVAPPPGVYTFPSLQPRKVEPLAILSVVTSPLAIVGLGFGIGSLRRLKSRKYRGRKLALTGIVLSTLFLTIIILGIITMALNGTFARMSEEPVPGDFPDTRVVATVNLAPGNCIATLPVTRTVGEVTAVPCANEHLVQVTDKIPAGSGEYPGEEALFETADSECASDLAGSNGVESWYLVPSQENWEQDERNIMCLLRSTSGPITMDFVN